MPDTSRDVTVDTLTQDSVHRHWLQRPLLQVFLVVALGLGVYLHTLSAPFILDDLSCIRENPAVRDFGYLLDFDKVWELEIWDDIKKNMALRTVTYWTFALNYQFGGLNEVGYHVVNIGIHLLNAVLVYLLAHVTLSSVKLAWKSPHSVNLVPLLTALLFVAHPLQTQAVTYINQRFTSLVTLFYLAALLLYIGARTAKQPAWRLLCYTLALLTTLLAMKTQELAFTLPIMLLVYEQLFLGGCQWRQLRYLSPFFATMLVIPATLLWLTSTNGIDGTLGQITQSINLVNYDSISQWDYLFTQFGVIVTYLRMFFLPTGQNILPYYPLTTDFFELKTIGSLLLLLLIFGWATWQVLRSIKFRQPSAVMFIAFGILWFFITIAMTSSVIPLEPPMLEYRVYLPSFGVFFSASVAAAVTIDRGWIGYRVVVAISLLFITLLSTATYLRNDLYNDKYAMLRDILARNPEAEHWARYNLAHALLESRRYDEAIVELLKILQYLPNDTNMMVNLGYALEATGRESEAIRLYHRALELNPGSVAAHSNLGIFYYKMGILNLAEEELRMALAIDPHAGAARQNLATLYEDQGRIAEAIEQYRQLLRSHPNNKDVISMLEQCVEKQKVISGTDR